MSLQGALTSAACSFSVISGKKRKYFTDIIALLLTLSFPYELKSFITCSLSAIFLEDFCRFLLVMSKTPGIQCSDYYFFLF